jgi:Protein of unknown function (DUF1566)
VSGCHGAKSSSTTDGVALWATWPMPNAPALGLPNPQNYDLTTDSVVTDRVTGLMWQSEAPNEFYTFDTAQQHCAALSLAGFDDWRAPSRIELVSILDMTRIQPSIDASVFPNTANDGFWSASLAADNPSNAWYVYFYFGYPKTDDRGNKFSLRCVRTAVPHALPSPRYDVETDLVKDVATGLTWQHAATSAPLPFDDATTYCSTLNLASKTGFRLPTLPELLTLIDERAASPMIDGPAFPDTPKESFWTSSLFGNVPGMAWYVSFDNGSGLYGLPSQPARVRCVL